MKIVIFTHSSYSHVNAIKNTVISLCNDYEVYCFLEEENINIYGKNKNLHYIAYNKQLDKQFRKLLHSHYSFLEKKEIVTIDDIVEEVKHPLEYMLEGSMIYVKDIISIIKKIQPDYILRDACSLFGRIIGDELSIPVLGYTTSPVFTDEFMECDLKKYLPYSLKRNLDCFTDSEINILYTKIKEKFISVCSKYNVRKLPINYLTCPDEIMNFCYGTEKLNFIGNKEKNRYLFMKPRIFENSNVYTRKRDTIIVSSGSVVNFPIKLYNYIINAFKNEPFVVEISQKYYGTNIFKINNLPENIHFNNFIKQTELLKKSAILITHGGYNSILEAIFYEVPILAYAISHDQFMNSDKIEELGIGIDLGKRKLSGYSINKIALELINSVKVKENLLNIKKEILLLNSDEVKKYIEESNSNDIL